MIKTIFWSYNIYSKKPSGKVFRGKITFFLFTAWKMFVFGVFLVRVFPYSVRMWGNTDLENSEYRHFSALPSPPPPPPQYEPLCAGSALNWGTLYYQILEKKGLSHSFISTESDMGIKTIKIVVHAHIYQNYTKLLTSMYF